MTKVYLCGPINGCTDEECKDWREAAKTRLPDTLDPMRRDYRGKEAESYREIVELDKRDIEASNVVLVNYDRPSVGTSMEILWAWLKETPVVVVCKADAVISPWLRYHSTEIVHSFDEAFRWIEAL
jgi:nucleoside 2-deoxyribosyltransferase